MIIKKGSENKLLNNNILAIESEAIKAKKRTLPLLIQQLAC